MNETLITILTQDKKNILLIKSGKIEVTKNLGGKSNKYSIVAGNELWSNVLGYYPDEESALNELGKIFAAIDAGAKTYTVE